MFRSVFNAACALFFEILFRRQSTAHEDKSLYIFDIDNTIGNTYPTLNQKFATDKERILSVAPFERMKNLVVALQQSKSRKVLFMTSRSYLQWILTCDWLIQNHIPASLFDVIIVNSPAEKIRLISSICPRQKKITYIDDHSWNHENGQVKFYEPDKLAAENLPIRYIGYKTILRFNSKIRN